MNKKRENHSRSSPLIGYLAAIILPGVFVTITLLLFRAFPTFAFAGVLEIFIVALIALTWGAGPSLVATLIGALLLEFVIVPSPFAWRLDNVQQVVETLLFVSIGVIISIVASQSHRARRSAEELARSLAEANRQMSDFLSLASHELRTPLTGVIGHLQLSQRRLERFAVPDARYGGASWGDEPSRLAPIQETLQRAEEQARFMNRLVGDLLDASRIQADRFALQPLPCNLATIVQEAVQEQQLTWPDRTIALRLPDESKVPVQVDADRIGQVVTNYLTNALKYSPQDMPVEVSLCVKGQQAQVQVRDYGPGLPAAEQQRIWERFHRAPGIEVQSGSGVGLGLGLHISRTIIEQHQGQVGVESMPGKGSTFWFTLPLAGFIETEREAEYGDTVFDQGWAATRSQPVGVFANRETGGGLPAYAGSNRSAQFDRGCR